MNLIFLLSKISTTVLILFINSLSIRIRYFFFTCLFLLLPLFSFNQSVIEQNQTSLAQIPVKYYLNELAKSLNSYYQINNQGIICVDDSFTNNNHDNFKVVCHQLDDIKVSSVDNKVITEVKVRVNAEYLIDYNLKINLWFIKIDRKISFVRDLNFDLYVKFTTDIYLREDLETQVKTEWEYEWLSVPFITFGPISFRVLKQTSPKVDSVIKNYAQNKIDKTILKKININQILYDVWKEFEEPILLNSDFNLWNYFRLQEIFSGNLGIDKEKITFPFQVKFNNYTGFGSNIINDNLEFWENIIPDNFSFSNLSITNDKFYLQMPLKLTVSDMERLIFDDITKKEYVFGTGNLQVKATEVYLSIDRDFVVAEVYLRSVSEASLLGSLVLKITFNPFYDIQKKKLRARYLTYEIVRSDTVLVDIVNALQKETFTKLLQDTIILEFDTYVNSIHQLMNDKLSNYAFNDKLLFNMAIDEISIKNIFIQGKEVYMIVDLTGKINLYLRNLF